MPTYDDPKPRRRNLAEAESAMRAGGRELGAITGEEEPEITDTNTLRQGFRRLLGVEKPVRRHGE